MSEENLNVNNLKYDERGLIPVIVQDASTHQVLMMAYMNREALHMTLKIGELVLWSRSRQTLWHKGETSGNKQRVIAMFIDCDADCLLVWVHPQGPACHTGHTSCFYRRFDPSFSWDKEDKEGECDES
jgi:phosphoribosyl-ATP pyrophosphohydrolase/phosphoribosyl-AMP cyclohydrolase